MFVMVCQMLFCHSCPSRLLNCHGYRIREVGTPVGSVKLAIPVVIVRYDSKLLDMDNTFHNRREVDSDAF